MENPKIHWIPWFWWDIGASRAKSRSFPLYRQLKFVLSNQTLSMPMWCPEKNGRRNNWPFKLAPLGHYSSSPNSSHFAFEKATSPFRRSTADMAKRRSAKVCWKLKTFHPLFEYILAGQPSCRQSALSLDYDEALVVHGASKITQRGIIEELLFIRIKSIF